MEQQAPNSRSSTKDERRAAFLSALRPRAPILADLYQAACGLVANSSFPARGALLAHAVRELRNRLPDVFSAPTRAHLKYHERLKAIRPLWLPVAERLPGPSSMESAIDVPLNAAREISRLLEDDARGTEHIKTRFIYMCAVVSGEEIKWSGNDRLAAQWADINVEGVAHSGSSAKAEESALLAFETLDEIILGLFEYAPQRDHLLKGLAATATPATVLEHLRKLFTLHDVDTYFASLNNPSLFEPLRDVKTFEIDDIALNYWPQGSYLQNIAKARPEDVATVLAALKETTPGITRQMLSLALSLPDEPFVKVMRKGKWLRGQPALDFLDPILKALSRLADLGQEPIVFGIAKHLFEVDVEMTQRLFSDVDRARAVPVIDRHSFESVLETVPEVLSRVWPVRALNFLRNTLDHVISIEGYDEYDHHGFWYENFLDNEARRYDVKTELTGAVLDLSLKLSETRLSEVVSILDSAENNRSMYRRMADAVIARNGTDKEISARIEHAATWTYGNEWRALLERGFALLPEQRQIELLDATYKNQHDVIRRNLAEYGRDESEADDLVDDAVARLFGAASAATPEPYRSRLTAALSAEKDEPASSPPDLDALEHLGPTAIGSALERWVPRSDGTLDAPWGLGGSLRLLVERNAATWLASPESFTALPAYYLGWALNGLDGYRRGPSVFDPRVLEIVNAALTRAFAANSTNLETEREIARQITQSAGSLLIEESRKATTSEAVDMFLDSAKRLSGIHLPHVNDVRSPWSGPTYDRSHPTALAVHVIGTLLVAAHNHNLDPSNLRVEYANLFRTEDIAVRAALGHFFSSFTTKFPDDAPHWARSIFLSDNEDANRSAWAGFVIFSNPNLSTYLLLLEAYRKRLNDIATMPRTGTAREPSDIKTVRDRTLWHIWALLANHFERLDDETSLAHQLATTGSDIDLQHLLSEVGRSLKFERSNDSSRLVQIFAAAMQLWEHIEGQVARGERSPDVLLGAPNWIASPLPPNWRFQRAESIATEKTVIHRDAWLVVKALVVLGSVSQFRSLKIIEELLRPPRSEVLTAVQQYASPLLVNALSGSTDEKHLARLIDGYLVTNHRRSLLDPK